MKKYGNYKCYIAQTPISDDKEMYIGACTKDTSKNIIMLIVVAKKGAETDCVQRKDSRAELLNVMYQLTRPENCKPMIRQLFL